jgi:ribosome modulation factor
MSNELVCRCPACAERDAKLLQMAERNPSAIALLREGFVAASQDKSASECPHPLASENWQTWMFGWVNGVVDRHRMTPPASGEGRDGEG